MRRAPTYVEAYQPVMLEILTTTPVCGAWMKLAPPTEIPPWPSPSKKTRSPGCNWSRETGVPIPYWAYELCGSETPTCPNTYMTRPEQSNPEGDAPPQRYGTPRERSAIATTLECVGGGAGPTGGA